MGMLIFPIVYIKKLKVHDRGSLDYFNEDRSIAPNSVFMIMATINYNI